ncbi:MAG: hypothetical protein N2572_05680 [Syntrophales bacterium]|nr:hypothetical protein [Syntrophales bacterium]
MFRRTPENPEVVSQRFLSDLKSIFGQDLESVVLYGSGAREDYIPGRSDLNYLVSLSSHGLEKLEEVWSYIKRWRRAAIALPLFVTRDFVRSSVDVFPIEFLNMSIHYRLIYGLDVLADIEINRNHLRLQLEREFRGKLLHLREGFVSSQGKEGELKNLISLSISAFVSLFVGLLYLKGMSIPAKRRDIIASFEQTFDLKGDVLGRCLDIREGKTHIGRGKIVELYREYLAVIRNVCQIVDKMAL